MASNTEELSDFYLLQPELLNEFTLRQILELRCVKLPNLYSMSKEQLVEVFHRVAVPLPQRKYRDNRRGKLLSKMRRKLERNRRRPDMPEQKSAITYGFSEASSSRVYGLHGARGSHQTGDRLKPPPDAINFERKKIKLSSSISRSVDLDEVRVKRLKKFDNSDTNGDALDRIIIKDRRKEKEREEKKESHKSTSDNSTNRTSPSRSQDNDLSKSESKCKKIKLKRSHSTVGSESSSTATTSSSSETKKHTTIKWP